MVKWRASSGAAFPAALTSSTLDEQTLDAVNAAVRARLVRLLSEEGVASLDARARDAVRALATTRRATIGGASGALTSVSSRASACAWLQRLSGVHTSIAAQTFDDFAALHGALLAFATASCMMSPTARDVADELTSLMAAPDAVTTMNFRAARLLLRALPCLAATLFGDEAAQCVSTWSASELVQHDGVDGAASGVSVARLMALDAPLRELGRRSTSDGDALRGIVALLDGQLVAAPTLRATLDDDAGGALRVSVPADTLAPRVPAISVRANRLLERLVAIAVSRCVSTLLCRLMRPRAPV